MTIAPQTTTIRLEDALARWLPGQRWFGGKGRPIAGVDLVHTADIADRGRRGGPRATLAVVAVRFADRPGEEPHLYQVPLGMRHSLPASLDHALVGWVDGAAVYDATADQDVACRLLDLIARGHERDGVRLGLEPTGGHAFAHRRGLPVRPIGADQSNTSLVFGDRFVLKLFRRLTRGVNPDLQVHRALGAVGSAHIAPLLGAVETEIGGDAVTLGVLHSFAADSTTGWDLATTGARSRRSGVDMAAEADALGAAVAAVHVDLRRSLGEDLATEADAEVLREAMFGRLVDAVRAQPALEQVATAVAATLDQVATELPGEPVQRVHGDLHLGQALRTPSRWLLIDFEGEPAAPRAERVAAHSPLRDVAGMLRSFDYAAMAHLRTRPPSDPARLAARRWAKQAREAFLAGYARTSGVDLVAKSGLLAAYELDKALYEVMYETGNRPDWVDLPLRAVRELAGVDGPVTIA